MESCIWQ